MKHLKKIILSSLALLTCSITLYAYAVNHPTNALSHKACTSWKIVERKMFTLFNTDFSMHSKLDRSKLVVKQGTATEAPVLMYHYITPKADNREPGNKSVVDLETFEQNMKFLYDNGYRTVSLSELEQYVNGEISLPQKSFVITFDDGYQNNYTLAYPVLKKYNFHASLFVIGSRIQPEPVAFDSSKKSDISKPEMEAGSDVFEYNSHTFNLHHKGYMVCGDDLPITLDTNLLDQDIEQIKRAGIDTPYIAYPYGYFSVQMIYKLQQHGYRMGFTVIPGFVRPGDSPMVLPRLTVTNETDLSILLQTDSNIHR
ncbi:MAG: polysaccharide deacetylase family protein [Paenibacillus sp.]|uniref:polysaccharide deacetylase family protein n=1 Tax=Paenibacillus sp. TaxID=58172 RepID=UPI0025D05ED7|nr:polysaccharide deacetylase family protein [Paenibacillus sp.]MBR2566684.1 polysaccharide deacetylase family protein [Paenibacillus sp.]